MKNNSSLCNFPCNELRLNIQRNNNNKTIKYMKRIIIALMVTIAFCTLALAQKKVTIVKDSIGKAKITVTKTSSATDDEDSDTTFVAEWEDTPDSASNTTISATNDDDFPFNFDGQHFGSAALLIPIIAIIMGCGLPIFIIFITFFFRYKNKKAKYRLAEQALASGQPIPEGMFSEQRVENDIQTKGIKNTFMGIGLFIFLWALTGNFGIGCIGLLIMFTGLGQLVICYTQKPSSIEKGPYVHTSRNNQVSDAKANHEEKSDKPSTEE